MRPHVEPMAAKTILNRVRAPSMPFDWSINPYRGCQHGCSFCYARSTHAFLGQPADDAFQRHIYWKEGAPDILRGQLARLARLGRLPDHVAIGTATDPYQPLEAKVKLTRGCIEVLAEYGVPFSLTTRSPLVLRDLDILRRARVLSVNISLHTLDMRVWRRFEPASPAPRRRLETIGRLAETGVPVTVFAAPMLPYLTDSREAAGELAEACRERGAERAMVNFLRLQTPEVKQWFFGVLERHYPALVPVYGRLFYLRADLPDSYLRPARERVETEFRSRGLLGRKPEDAAIGRTADGRTGQRADTGTGRATANGRATGKRGIAAASVRDAVRPAGGPADGAYRLATEPAIDPYRLGVGAIGGADGFSVGPIGIANGLSAGAAGGEWTDSCREPLQLTLF